MTPPKNKITVGLAQITPVWLNKAQTIHKVINYIQQASAANCNLVAFGEAFVPGYPYWIELTNGAQFNSPLQKEMHAFYMSQAIQIETGDLNEVCSVCKQNNITVILGCIELAKDRGNHSLYCTLVYIGNDGEIKHIHRKLMPTYEERLSWSAGDGHGLQVHPLESFTVGALNCWENWMPLTRTALYGQGEDLHVALWPGSIHNTEDITRYIAKESRSFVLSVSSYMTKEDISAQIPNSMLIKQNAPAILSNGGSCLAGPDGKWIIEPVTDKEILLTAEIDHNFVKQERQNFDPAGHYSRPDVTQLIVNRKRQNILNITG